ncbi:MAG: BlaI/MecI/CopY family transcriptional regulator [Prevotellaceae bacterium]|jgi:predicted transcriptional regulator|nr:BlaI/MecI/CopY family transcriptional regulator [Prevotellaceae bacterium]
MTQRLTKAEEQVLQILWELQEGTVQDIRDKFEEPRPARTTIATVLNILENKQFVSHTAQGRVNLYAPIVAKESYSKAQLLGIMKNYFNNSFASLVSFFAKENNLSIDELDELIEKTKEELRKENQH